MSKEHIEEMAKDIGDSILFDDFDFVMHDKTAIIAQRAAEKMTAKGYRKQSDKTVELPCNIGETMYVVSRYYTGSWEIFKCKVDSITMYGTHTFISLMSVKGNFTFGENVSSINKNVFFDEGEAKKAWAKMKGGAE